MTSKLKCPFCQQELRQDYTGVMYCCNEDCEQSADWYGSQILWKALIQAKQGLVIPTDSESRQITYMADGRTKVYYGQNGTQIETNLPLPVGFVITIKETTNDK